MFPPPVCVRYVRISVSCENAEGRELLPVPFFLLSVLKSFANVRRGGAPTTTNRNKYIFAPRRPPPPTGSRDTFLVGVASEQYPELEQVCNKLLPGNVQREDNGTGSGTGGVAGAETPAERRAAAKREGRAHFQQTRQGKTGKRDARVQAIKTATQEAVSAAVSGVAQELKETWQPQQQESKWRQQTDKADSKVAKIELAQSTVNAHIKFDHMLKEEEATGGEEDEHSRKRKRFLKKQLIFLEAQMETDSEDE